MPIMIPEKYLEKFLELPITQQQHHHHYHYGFNRIELKHTYTSTPIGKSNGFDTFTTFEAHYAGCLGSVVSYGHIVLLKISGDVPS